MIFGILTLTQHEYFNFWYSQVDPGRTISVRLSVIGQRLCDGLYITYMVLTSSHFINLLYHPLFRILSFSNYINILLRTNNLDFKVLHFISYQILTNHASHTNI